MNNIFEREIAQISEKLANSEIILRNHYNQEPDRVVSSSQYSELLKEVESRAVGIEQIPELNGVLYAQSLETGDREIYENPYDARRVNLSVAVFLVISEKNEYLPIVEKYLAAICDESTWVIPAHDGRLIDLYSADTVLTLAESVVILQDRLSPEIVDRVYNEVRKKIFDPYENQLEENIWYDKGDNWTAVCNSCIGCAYLLLEPDKAKQTKAIETVLLGLRGYIEKAFTDDGGTDEGVLYWNYGMGMFTIFAEQLFYASNGEINLYKDPKINKIAEFPAHMMLGEKLFISFSDAYEHGTQFHPGYIQRIATMSENPRLLGLLSYRMPVDCFELPNLISYCTWWDGKTYAKPEIASILLPDLGIAKVVSTKLGYPVIVSAKAGNNEENHNHNDIGSWILTVDGENFFTDPGPGKYSGDYFSERRYENLFVNSYGHSVPVIDGQTQRQGKEYSGSIEQFSGVGGLSVSLDLRNAYPVIGIERYLRRLEIIEETGKVRLTDEIDFKGGSHAVQEAFVTFKSVTVVDEEHLRIQGERHSLEVSVEAGKFEVEVLEKDSLANEKDQILKRISVNLEECENFRFVLHCTITG